MLPITDLPSPQSPEIVGFFAVSLGKKNIFLEKVSVTVDDSAALKIMPSLAGNLK